MNLQQKNIDLQSVQQGIIENILNQQQAAGIIKSDAEYQTILQSYMTTIEAGQSVMQVVPVSGIVDGTAMTQTLQDFNIDIMTSFSALNGIDAALQKHMILNQAVINSTILAIKQMTDTLNQYEAKIGVNGAQGLYLQRFRDNNSMALWTQALYIDRENQAYAPAEMAVLDPTLETLKLPTSLSDNQLIGSSGVRLGQIQLVKQLGGGLSTIINPQTALENAIDSSMQTFWSASILMDQPIAVEEEFNFYTKDGTAQTLAVTFGALSVLTINFDYMSSINQITLNPYTSYPIQLLAILYYDEVKQQWISVVSPYDEPGDLPAFFSDTISYEFTTISTKQIQLILNQIHYTKQNIVVNSQDQQNLTLWFGASAGTIDVPVNFQNQPTYQDQAELYPMWANFLNQMKNQELDITQVVTNLTVNETSSITKYEYNYGLYNIGIFNNEYTTAGVYVSVPIPTTKTVRAVQLQTDEFHPFVEVTAGNEQIITDIEFAVSPDDIRWYELLPTTRTQVDAELLFPIPPATGTVYTATLRFTPISTVIVMANGIPLSINAYSVNGLVINLYNYDIASLYTAAYIPDPSSTTIDFLAMLTRDSSGAIDISAMDWMAESFAGTDASGYIDLTFNPFVDKERLLQYANDLSWNPTYLQGSYVPIIITLIDPDGMYITQSPNDVAAGLYLVNVTDYFDPNDKPNLVLFDQGMPNYQYQVFGNRIQFNTTLSSSYRIQVQYPYLVGDLRLRAVLRRNSHQFQGITPMLNEYTMTFDILS